MSLFIHTDFLFAFLSVNFLKCSFRYLGIAVTVPSSSSLACVFRLSQHSLVQHHSQSFLTYSFTATHLLFGVFLCSECVRSCLSVPPCHSLSHVTSLHFMLCHHHHTHTLGLPPNCQPCRIGITFSVNCHLHRSHHHPLYRRTSFTVV